MKIVRNWIRLISGYDKLYGLLICILTSTVLSIIIFHSINYNKRRIFRLFYENLKFFPLLRIKINLMFRVEFRKEAHKFILHKMQFCIIKKCNTFINFKGIFRVLFGSVEYALFENYEVLYNAFQNIINSQSICDIMAKIYKIFTRKHQTGDM